MRGDRGAAFGWMQKIFQHTGDGALGSSAGNRSTHGRPSDLGAHGGGNPGSDNTSGGHFDGWDV